MTSPPAAWSTLAGHGEHSRRSGPVLSTVLLNGSIIVHRGRERRSD